MIYTSPTPSFASGYAKNVLESAHPTMWRGLQWCVSPALGFQSKHLLDVPGKRTLVADLNDNRNYGTLTNMSVSNWRRGRNGVYTLDFDASNQTVDFYNHTGTRFQAADPFSVAGVFRLDDLSTTVHSLIGHLAITSPGWVIYTFDTQSADALICAFVSGGVGTRDVIHSGANSLVAGQWFRFVFTKGGDAASSMSFYVDNTIPKATILFDESPGAIDYATNSRLWLSNQYNIQTRGLDGACEFAGIWNRVLTLREITDFMAGATPLHRRRRVVYSLPEEVVIKRMLASTGVGK